VNPARYFRFVNIRADAAMLGVPPGGQREIQLTLSESGLGAIIANPSSPVVAIAQPALQAVPVASVPPRCAGNTPPPSADTPPSRDDEKIG